MTSKTTTFNIELTKSNSNSSPQKTIRTNVNIKLSEKYDDYDPIYGELVGKIVDNDQQVDNFITRQYDLIDIQTGIQQSNKEPVQIRVQNIKQCKHFLDIENLQRDQKKIINFHSPQILKCLSMNKDENQIYIIFEDIKEGQQSLAQLIMVRKQLEEEEVKKLVIKVAIGVNHLQSVGLSHHDLNAENVYVHVASADVKLINPGFGFKAAAIQGGQLGDQNQQPPEAILNNSLDASLDSQSMGVLIQVMLCGQAPINNEGFSDFKSKLKQRRQVNLNHKELWDVSFDCKSLIFKCLSQHPKSRLGPIELIKSVWLEATEEQLVNWSQNMDQFDVLIRHMFQCTKFKPIEIAIRRSVARRAKILNLEQIQRLFMKFDQDYSGFFSGDEFKRIMDIPQMKNQNFDQKMVFACLDVNGDNKIEQDEFIAQMADFDPAFFEDNLLVLLKDIDQSRKGDIHTNDLGDFFRRYDVNIQSRTFLTLFPKGSSKMLYAQIVDMQFNMFQPQDHSQQKEHLHNIAENLSQQLKQSYID